MDELMEPAGKDIRATALCNAALADLADQIAVPHMTGPALRPGLSISVSGISTGRIFPGMCIA